MDTHKTHQELNVRIKGLTVPQKEALEDMLATWMCLGSLGSSRWTSFFADGDGDFRPKITVKDKRGLFSRRPKFTDRLERKKLWKSGDYRIDYDALEPIGTL